MNLHTLIGIIFIIFVATLLGYKILFDAEWIDALYYTSTSLTTIDMIPYEKITTFSQKVFLSILALISGLIVVTVASYIVSSILSNKTN